MSEEQEYFGNDRIIQHHGLLGRLRGLLDGLLSQRQRGRKRQDYEISGITIHYHRVWPSKSGVKYSKFKKGVRLTGA